MERKHKFIVKSYNTKELAEHYGLSQKTMRKWLKLLKPELGVRIGNYYRVNQVKIIVKRLGKPGG